MTTIDVITERFCQVDDRLKGTRQHPQADLWPSEVMTLARWQARKRGGHRAFSHGRVRDARARFPHRPERTRRFRRFKTPGSWSYTLMAKVTRLGVADPDGIERLHRIRKGRRAAQLGHPGVSHHRWIVRIKRGVWLDGGGVVVRWVWVPAPIMRRRFHPWGTGG